MDVTCAEFATLAPELALGLLSGDERAAALAHVARCSACRRNLDDLARTADALLLIAPWAEPPAGFESGVLNRLAADTTTRPHGGYPRFRRLRGRRPTRPKHPRRWIRPLLAGAALVVLAGTIGLVAGRDGSSHPRPVAAPPPSPIRTALVSTDAGKSTCQVVALPGRDGQGAEILLRLDEIAEKASAYPVMVEPAAGGRAIFVGMVSVDNGTGNFDRVLPSSIGKISGVQVMDDDGSLRYRATFAAG